MIKLQKLLIILVLLAALIPAWYVNRWLQNFIQPRRSFGQFILYMVSCLILVFLYSFLLVFLISRLFPLPNR